MVVVPDDKDWTWVLDRPCPECGFDAAAIDRADVPSRITAACGAWGELLAAPTARHRPDDATWSALEYGCHVRDVHRVYAGRVGRMLAEDDPHYENWDQDATALDDGYADQEPAVVARELDEAGGALADLLAGVDDDGWARTGRRSDGASFTIESIARYYLHDIEHHVWDVTGSRP